MQTVEMPIIYEFIYAHHAMRLKTDVILQTEAFVDNFFFHIL